MDIRIERASHACSACNQPFRDGEELITALKQVDPTPAYKRFDICSRCFPKYDQTGLHCFWENTHSAKRRSPLLDSDTLWQVFHRCQPGASENVESAEFAYVAALGLMRLKHLALESTRKTAGGEYLVLRTKGKEKALFEVRDPNLDETGIERVQERLADIDAAVNNTTTESKRISRQ
ncbi:MAG: hypothetical protein L6Q71_11910 [Planctomycetes bacterium]|nr:hypothetical protein [Planctomycetota bacterium]NUQ33388.1 hypothetical protein [Planctomycetaceae bacterium]